MTARETLRPQARPLSRLLAEVARVDAAHDPLIHGLSLDSRQVAPGDLFFACAGTRTHGARHIAGAIEAGAAAVLREDARHAGRVDLEGAVPVYHVADLKSMMGRIAARFYDDPSRDMAVTGITGTNGKTSCSHFLAQALDGAGAPCGLLGTLGYGRFGELHGGRHTTPDAITLQAWLARLRHDGVRQVVMEVSSHALDQGRVAGVHFDTAVFTNLSRDHLDYHGDLESYAAAKSRLFQAPGLRHAVINGDDETGRRLLTTLAGGIDVVVYGLGDGASAATNHQWARYPHVRRVRGEILRHDGEGMEIRIESSWGAGSVRSTLLGRFNASNLLATLAALLVQGVPMERAAACLARTCPVPGRMEHFGGGQGRPLVVIDYAHTPDALRQVLQTLRPLCAGLLWAVFGCGGDRDRGKRHEMGAVAARHADRVILTDDNPRTEDGARIIADIAAGMGRNRPAEIVRDRARAICHAIASAGQDDVVLVAGKGHEEYQIVGERRIPFSDREQVAQALREVA